VSNKSTQYWLTLDLSTSIGGICLHQSSPFTFLSERKLNDKFKHSEELIDSLDKVLSENGISLNQISLFITTLGPGSFTGLRIALTTLKALAFTHSTPIAVVPSHECRFLLWAKSHTEQAQKKINVLTLLSATSAHLAKYHLGNLIEEVFGTAEELKAMECDVLISDLFPFEVSNLASAYSLSKQKKIARTWDEIQALSPEYWGSKYRTIFDGESAKPTLPK
jgi:tRNA threonylcarbamoyl adenosine modification protein YeaZ